MKLRKAVAIAVVTTIVVAAGGVGFFYWKAGLYNRDVSSVTEDLGKQMNTSQMFEFKPEKVKEKTKIMNADSSFKEVPLYLGDNKYINVRLPFESQIITDSATYIYDQDMKFKVMVIDNVADKTDLVKSFGLTKGIEYTNNIAVTKTGVKLPQEAATMLYDNKGIVATCYDSPQTFATILSGFEKNTVASYSYPELAADKTTKLYTSVVQLPAENTSSNSLLSSNKDAGAYMYAYTDGYLTEFNATIPIAEFKKDLLTRVCLSQNGGHLDGLFEASSKSGAVWYYAEIGSYTVLCVGDTINHTYACLGNGATARQNIASYVRNRYNAN